MNILSGETIGNIHIIVCETKEGKYFFKIETDNENILPVVDIIEDTLVKY